MADNIKSAMRKVQPAPAHATRGNDVRRSPAASGGARAASWQTPERSLQRLVSSAALRNPEQVLAVLDIDHFRALRNTHGSGASEYLLRTFGRRLEYETASRSGRMLRLGTDEFAVLIPRAECNVPLDAWAESMLETACLPFSYRGAMFSFTASVGVSTLPAQGNAAAEALRCARQAVTRSKELGGGRVTICSEGEMAKVAAREELARELPAAIAQGQLVPFYQPVIALPSERVVGMEVLARWVHPKHGLLEPAAFIPIAEEHGMCLALTRSLLCQVGEDARHWPRKWNFALNTTPNELPAILEFIASLQHGIGGSIESTRIELEVTETALMRDIELSRRAITAMQPCGVKVVLDDFGSGYANFKQLRQVPFSRLKIDKSFITDMRDDPRSEACAQAIIDLAHHLGMTATAEGVEGAEVANRLSAMGCDHAQGYHFGRPMPAAAIDRVVASARPPEDGTLEFAA